MSRNKTGLSLTAQEQRDIQEEILKGTYGVPGTPFLTTRELAARRHVSLVTAHNILVELAAAGYVELRGKRYILTHGELIRDRQERDNVIGLILPRVNNEFYSSLADRIVASAAQEHYRVIVMSAMYSDVEEKAVIQALCRLGIAGIISCFHTGAGNEALYNVCPVPCVMLGHSLRKSRISSVQVNSFAISQKVAEHLAEEGYRDFIYIGTGKIRSEGDDRFTAFRMALARMGFSLGEADVFRLSDEPGADDARLERRLQEQEEPLGVFCYHDLLAERLYFLCHRLEKSIPGDVGIAGFDDLSIAAALNPPLTTVQYRVTTMADMALNLLLTKIRQPEAPYDNYYIEPNLTIRGSTALTGQA